MSRQQMRLATIGVYGFDRPSFIACLLAAGIRTLLDVRQRRGVRGTAYAWANSLRLQAALEDASIGYRHLKHLAPTTELRQLQYAEDARVGVGKRSRRELAAAYVSGYTADILNGADLRPVLDVLRGEGPAALLCVERDAVACHRSLISQRLATAHGVLVNHLVPPRLDLERPTDGPG